MKEHQPDPAADRYGVIGHPIAHSRSPFIHGEFAKATRQHLVYERFDIAPAELALRVKQLFGEGVKGLNVTVPHKEAVVALTQELTDRAKLAGAVNTLITLPNGGLRGDNTDGAGLIADLRYLGIGLRARSVLVIGAGGATRGIVGPLLEQQPAEVVVANRNLGRAEQLVAAFRAIAAARQALLSAQALDELHRPFDVVIHATSLGLQNATPLVDPAIIGATTDAYDLGYGDQGTTFTRWARQHGAAQAHDGIGMLVEQAAEAFWLWRGVRPDTTEVRRYLTHSGGRNKP